MAVPYFPMPVLGGMQKQAYLLAKSLVEDGHSVVVLARRFHPSQKPVEKTGGIEVIRLIFGNGVLRLFDEVYQLRIPMAMFSRRKDFDIVHVHTLSLAGILALSCAKMLRKKTLLKIPNVGFPGFGMCRWPLLGRGAIGTAKRSDAVVALCPKSVEELLSAGFSSERIFKVTNGTDVQNESFDRRSRDRREIRVVFLGRLVPDKGIVDLLKAWKIVRTEGGDLQSVLYIYGDGPQRTVLDKTIREESLADSVRLCGRVDDVRSAMDDADILAHPSYREGNSNAVLEAMASGIPVVGSDISGNSTLVGESGIRFLHDPGDHVNLAEILLQLLRDGDLRRATGRKMRERALEYFQIDQIKDKYVETYRMILDGRSDQICDISDFPTDS